MGTPAFAVPALRAVAERCDVIAVVTRPDRARGRGREPAPSEIAAVAAALGIPALKPEDLRSGAVIESLAAFEADLFAVVAFGAILSPALLATPRLGCINLHGSLLPDYRGASPVQRVLWDGRPWTGVTTLWMDEGVDTGDVILQRWMAVEPSHDAGSLAAALAELGAPLLAESLCRALAGTALGRPQERGAGSYAGKMRKQDGEVDWTLDAVTVWNHQRAVTPWPGAATACEGRRLQILTCAPLHLLPATLAPGTVLEAGGSGVAVCCGRGALLLREVRPDGRAAMNAADWARGARLHAGTTLGASREAHA
jgi:methionyl-tRNA formyltransferase